MWLARRLNGRVIDSDDNCQYILFHPFSTDVSSLATLLPPKVGVVKYLPLSFTDIPRLVGGATHIVLSQPRDLPPKSETKVSN